MHCSTVCPGAGPAPAPWPVTTEERRERSRPPEPPSAELPNSPPARGSGVEKGLIGGRGRPELLPGWGPLLGQPAGGPAAGAPPCGASAPVWLPMHSCAHSEAHAYAEPLHAPGATPAWWPGETTLEVQLECSVAIHPQLSRRSQMDQGRPACQHVRDRRAQLHMAWNLRPREAPEEGVRGPSTSIVCSTSHQGEVERLSSCPHLDELGCLRCTRRWLSRAAVLVTRWR